jgi:hypothetical protein
MRDPENPSASVHRKRFLTPSLPLKFLCTGELNPRDETKASVSSKLARGTFTAAFFLASLVAIGCEAIRLEDI